MEAGGREGEAVRRDEFTRCCQAIEEGEEIYLEETGTHQRGKILFCSDDEFGVLVEDEMAIWPPGACEEVGSSSEAPGEGD